MKKYFTLMFVVLAFSFNSCTNAQTSNNNLTATEFADKIKTQPKAVILDVRTPEEFSAGHLANAKNYNWNGPDFEKQIAPLDKSKPVFVYCHSGGRSTAAANKLRADGFKKVYELSGGIMKWRAASLPEIKAESVKQ
jgi:thioredoxin 1